ncbi:MAG: hypothetical protein WA973_11175 [Mesorhizobium sp.]
MADVAKILGLIENCDDPERLRSWIRNAQEKGEPRVANAAFRRLVSVLPKEKPGTVEHDFWQTIHAFEHVLSEGAREDHPTRPHKAESSAGGRGPDSSGLGHEC